MQTERRALSTNSTEQFPHNFCTGSSFAGELDYEGKPTGFGIYRYPNGVEYHGYFKEGVYHGRGMLIHPSKFKMCGLFENGIVQSYQTFFGDGLEYLEENWNYCTDEDRRFWIEVVRGISPVGETFLTKEKPCRKVPPGLYDAEEGLYDPRINYIVHPDTGKRMRYVCPVEKKDLLETCRMNQLDYLDQEEAARKARLRSISTDSWVSSDEED